MSPKASPAKRLQLARALIALRERAGLSQQQLADRAEVSKGTVVRYESWRDRSGVNPRTIRDLAKACDAKPDAVEAVVLLAKTTRDHGWWADHAAVPGWMNPLLAFEDWSSHEHVYANALVPGLLQTPAYARAIQGPSGVHRSEEEITAKVDARLRRQAILDRGPSFHLRAVLDEAVLRRVVGDRSVMAEQLDHLLTLTERPTVEIQVIPFDAGATKAAAGHFLILGREDVDTGIVFVELQQRGLYLDDEAELSAYTVSFDQLRSQAASPNVTKKLLDQTRREFRR